MTKPATLTALLLAFSTSLPLLAETNYKELLLKAMNAPDGKASAEITGQVADLIRTQIKKPQAKIVADVSTLEELKQEGCKRLKIRFTTPGTFLLTTDGKARILDMETQLNLCKNGQPPAS